MELELKGDTLEETVINFCEYMKSTGNYYVTDTTPHELLEAIQWLKENRKEPSPIPLRQLAGPLGDITNWLNDASLASKFPPCVQKNAYELSLFIWEGLM